MSLYATAPSPVFAVEEVGCSCVACRFGRSADRPARLRLCTTDMKDVEWQAIASLLPWRAWLDGNGERLEEHCRRLVIDAICYVADNGNKWRNLPAGYGMGWKTLHAIFTVGWPQRGCPCPVSPCSVQAPPVVGDRDDPEQRPP
ncbi:transposase [Streptomyces colonosanans]|uniref:transposase n=1 Tax=Streptomyces colonosanans TaxID=1428652 RepID=UPI0009A0BF4B|nr:transposase [Streptomyces colonosanans]